MSIVMSIVKLSVIRKKNIFFLFALTGPTNRLLILCTASGAKLGDLMSIDYNRGERSVYSRTKCEVEDDLCFLSAPPMSIDIEPDIDISDTVTFVWQIA